MNCGAISSARASTSAGEHPYRHALHRPQPLPQRRRGRLPDVEIRVPAQGEPWPFAETLDRYVCLNAPMVVETRAPHAVIELETGESCAVPPKTAHYIHGKDNGRCRFLLLQGVGVYDNMTVGG
jgi:hypothetical protein